MRSVDLNCDLGEGTGADDLALLDVVTSANIACCGHAGDEETMAATVEAALSRGVAIGAHPGYPDRANFGRVALDLPAHEVEQFVFEQILALDRVARRHHGQLTHVKLHGALYHKAMTDIAVAGATAAAVARFTRKLVMVAMPRTVALRTWRERGFPVAVEAFADRVYEADGSLRSRALPGSLITDPVVAAEQAARLMQAPGERPHTICIHSDTPGASAVAVAVRRALSDCGFGVDFSAPYVPPAPPPRPPFFRHAIASTELRASQVPAAGSSWQEIVSFASTFDWSEMNPYGRISGPLRLVSSRESMTGLRAHLFFEYRRWNHIGDLPDEQTVAGVNRLLELIRAKALK
ncbi:MAG: 5-oxoprolinase subunit PxpA [Phycisphaerales bacterium]